MEIEFDVSLERPNTHFIDVIMRFVSPYDNPVVEMPSWTPGSYLIRDYARHIQKIRAYMEEGEVEAFKISKNSWQVNVKKNDIVMIKYSVYAFDLTVRTSYFDSSKLMLSPASVFMYLNNNNAESKGWEYTVSLNLSMNWQVFSSLNQINGKYTAKDFDELIDSPFCGGVDKVLDIKDYEYEDRGRKIPNKVVLIGEKGDQDIDKFTENLIKIQDESVRIFGDLPYNRYYWFLFVVGAGGGGLEHKNSNVSIINRWSFTDKEKFNRLMALESHEHFHVYNIKRIRPSQLGPFNYNSEVYTTLLWVAEGMTSFYDKITLIRSGIATPEEYFKMIASSIHNLSNIPGREVYSLAEASFDSWIKLYKHDENTDNSSVSYYLKGSLAMFCLDLEIRMQTNWTRSLDDFFKAMYLEYKRDKKGYQEKDIRMLIEKYTGTALKEFFDKYITGTIEIEYENYLKQIGYTIKPELKDKVWTGVKFKKNSNKVSFVYAHSPAERAGIYFKDEIIAVNGFRSGNGYSSILERCDPGDRLKVTLFRDSRLYTVEMVVEEPRPSKVEIVDLEGLTEEQKSRRKLFLGPYH